MDINNIEQYFANNQTNMLDLLINLAEINSGTFNVDGLNKVIAVLQQQFSELRCEQAIMPVSPMQYVNDSGIIEERPLGPVLRFWKRPDAPIKVLLVGHMDTVYAKDNSFQKTKRIGNDKLKGPGVTDMKGGIVVLLWALKCFEQLSQANNIGWEVLLNSDEEIGSPGSAEIIESIAKKHHLGFILEPPIDAHGTLAAANKGNGKFTFVMHGKAAHAGRNFADGRNAIYKMAEFINKLNSLNNQRKDLTFSVGIIHGGSAINAVPDLCICRVDSRASNPEDTDWALQEFQKIIDEINSDKDYRLELYGKYLRKPKILDEKAYRLYDLVKEIGSKQGLDISWKDTGGVTDGNNLSAMGLPNVDTLGVVGDFIHSSDEYMYINSMAERAQLLTNLLIYLSENGFE